MGRYVRVGEKSDGAVFVDDGPEKALTSGWQLPAQVPSMFFK